MKKIVRITESQLDKLIKGKITNEILNENMLPQSNDLNRYPVFIKHWENKFEKSVEILLKVGQGPEELINKINIIREKI